LLGLGCPKQAFAKIATPRNDLIRKAIIVNSFPITLATEPIKAQIVSWLRRYIARVQDDKTDDIRRKEAMNSVNPKYVLRNYLAQLAIDKAEQGDNSMVNELLEVLRHPYDEQPEHQTWAEKRPARMDDVWSSGITILLKL
jgi:uncharacterized protein YdiU (UPF0061 family)